MRVHVTFIRQEMEISESNGQTDGKYHVSTEATILIATNPPPLPCLRFHFVTPLYENLLLSIRIPYRVSLCHFLRRCVSRTILQKVRKVYKDENEDGSSKSKRLSSRLSIFRSGDESSSGAGAAGVAGAGAGASARPRAVAKGSVVLTSMGLATVRAVRSEDAMCEV